MGQAMEMSARLALLIKEDRGRLLAALIRQLKDFQLAEDVLQDAVETALSRWQVSGVPDNPRAWLLKVAQRKAIDRIRRDRTLQRKTDDMAVLAERDAPEMPDIPDERLRLIFTCCHPALGEKSRVALTLRCLGGLSTREIARAFLDNETAMGQRLSRAKAKIAAAGIPYHVPEPDEWNERLASVLRVIYLIFNEGYSAQEGNAAIRAALCEEAIFLAQMLDQLRPGEAEIEGLWALMLFAHTRRNARIGEDGLPRGAEEQDQALWDHDMWSRADEMLDRAVARRRPGAFQIQAAISALRMEGAASGVDWPQILLLYDRLYAMEPTPVVALNRAVALAEVKGPRAGLNALEPLRTKLKSYQPFHAAEADFLNRCNDHGAARDAYDRALAMSVNRGDIAFLKRKRAALDL